MSIHHSSHISSKIGLCIMNRTLFLLLVVSVMLTAQQPRTWKKTNFDYTANSSRINDIFFVDTRLGFVVNGIGQIHRTTDGGVTWTRQLNKGTFTHFRSVGFFDSLNGYAGALGWGDVNNPNAKDSVILYKTTNGGLLWSPEHQLSSSTIERGFCGMHVVNDSIVYGVGRVRGPAWFYRTTNRGATWTAKNMSAYLPGIIDVRFFSKDSGMIVGLTDTTHEMSRSIILSTADAGETWDTVFVGTRTNEWAWKITFPSRKIGYVSLQRNNNVAPVFILKTTDGGVTWTPKEFSATGYFVQGIGFLNDTLGWAGGTSLAPKQTTNGGETWTSLTIGNSLNRFRKLNDSLMYVSGAGVWKYSPEHRSVWMRGHRPSPPLQHCSRIIRIRSTRRQPSSSLFRRKDSLPSPCMISPARGSRHCTAIMQRRGMLPCRGTEGSKATKRPLREHIFTGWSQRIQYKQKK
jgi:photosystem II stability/assembly factor-like uncharacterized protein